MRVRRPLIAAVREVEPGTEYDADRAWAWLRHRLLTRAARLVLGKRAGDDWVYGYAGEEWRSGSKGLASVEGLGEAAEQFDAVR